MKVFLNICDRTNNGFLITALNSQDLAVGLITTLTLE